MKAFVFFAVVLLIFSSLRANSTPLARDSSAFRFTEKPGPYPVGLQVVEQYDYTRTYRGATDALGHIYAGERARPLQTLVWYPATEPHHANSMTVGEYANLWATETSFGHPNMPGAAKEWLADAKSSLSTPLWAVRNAPQAVGRFPVVIYSPGAFGEAWDNVDLCEYLASYGYIVIAGPTMGVNTRTVTLDVPGIEAPARDISFLIGYAYTLSNTDQSSIAVMGMSWGGIAALFEAARDSRVRALISLDGSLRYFPGLVKEAKGVPAEGMTIPLLAFVQRNLPLESWDRDDPHWHDGPSIFNAWTHGDFFLVRMLGLTHGFLSSAFIRNESVWTDLEDLHNEGQGDYGREDVSIGYGWMAHYTLKFLDAYLKHDDAALGFLKRSPAENGVPSHEMDVDYRPGSGVPPTLDGLRREVGRQGFSRLPEIYSQFAARYPSFKLSEALISNWGTELFDEHHFAEAAELLRLGTELYPASSALDTLLGDVYLDAGQKGRAVEWYKMALKNDPLDGNIKRKLDRAQ